MAGECPVCGGPVQVREGAVVFHAACAVLEHPTEAGGFDWHSAVTQLPVTEQDRQRTRVEVAKMLRGR